MFWQKKHQKQQLTGGGKKSPNLLGGLSNTSAKICSVQFLMLLWWRKCWWMHMCCFLRLTCSTAVFCKVPGLAFKSCESLATTGIKERRLPFWTTPNKDLVFELFLFTGGSSWLAETVSSSIIWKSCLKHELKPSKQVICKQCSSQGWASLQYHYFNGGHNRKEFGMNLKSASLEETMLKEWLN